MSRWALSLLILCACKSAEVAKCQSGLQGELLKKVLGASDARAFSAALGTHGPILEAELPCLVDATSSWDGDKRHFGAQALRLARGDEKVILAAQIKVASDTSDAVVWAHLADGLLAHHADEAKAALARPGMITKALGFSDSDARLSAQVQSTGLRAGLWANADGIEEALVSRLEAKEPELRQVALDGLSAERARKELPRIQKLLAEYEDPEAKHHPGSLFVSLIKALVRSGDPAAEKTARDALAKGFETLETVHGSRPEVMTLQNEGWIYPEPALDAFLAKLIREGDVLAPLGFSILATEVWAGHQPPGAALVGLCVAALEKGQQWDCNRLLFFMETGANPISSGGAKQKSTSVAFGQQWLAACEVSKACPP